MTFGLPPVRLVADFRASAMGIKPKSPGSVATVSENFEVIRSDVLRANYGQNPWQDRDQVVTSVSWVSRIEDARDSLLRSRWDLVIVDEAHKMSAYAGDKKIHDMASPFRELGNHLRISP